MKRASATKINVLDFSFCFYVEYTFVFVALTMGRSAENLSFILSASLKSI